MPKGAECRCFWVEREVKLSLQIEPQVKVEGRTHILFDANLVSEPTVDLFNVESLRRQGVVEGTAGGRGGSFIVDQPGKRWVLRHYRRGGLVSKVLNDQYFGCSRAKSRSWREWTLLAHLHEAGLPVPRPVAAAFHAAAGIYRADIITEFLERTQTLAQRLAASTLPADEWGNLGALIARFHRRNVFHADLNAHNILVGENHSFFLIDFDRGEIRPRGAWLEGNLNRLHRSVTKLQAQTPGFRFEEGDWERLLEGYRRLAG
ncbi:MAG: 3-deoxy-D-manno-octulosonic acid kinase [Desulfuromonas sp.]|nr:MAG: 3-deoxy-D-manno-octulosonic acid kinase [Desulfuromonas sp.]